MIRSTRTRFLAAALTCAAVLSSACGGAGEGTRAVALTTANHTSPGDLAAASEYLVRATVVEAPQRFTLNSDAGLVYVVSEVRIDEVIAQRPDVAEQLAVGELVPVGVSVLDARERDSIRNFSALAESFPTEDDSLTPPEEVLLFLVRTRLGDFGPGYEAVGHAVISDGASLEWRGFPGELAHTTTELQTTLRGLAAQFADPAPWRDQPGSPTIPEPVDDPAGRPAAGVRPEGTPEPSEPGTPQQDGGANPPQPNVVWEQQPEFAGKVVRSVQTSYTFGANSPDPNNGQILLSESWLRFDDDGVPQEYVARFSREDGTVVQTIYQTPDELRVLADPTFYRIPDELRGLADSGCIISGGSSAQSMLGNLPPFIGEVGRSALLTRGYEIGTAVSRLPDNPMEPGITATPTMSFVPAAAGTVFSRADYLEDGRARTRTVEYDPATGLMRSWRSIITDASGNVVLENAMAVTRVDVFSPLDVPSDIFGAAQTEGC